MEPTEHSVDRFDDRAADYARYRPTYPAAAVDAILADLGDPARLAVADVAAGTGILTRLLADRGAQVVAVEPNAAMRAAAAAHPRVLWREGTAEATGLDAEAFDLITVAQAFHWFDVAASTRELRRVLRPGGRLAILWNRRARDDAFTLGYRDALAAIDAEAPVERHLFDPDTVTSTGRFRDLRSSLLELRDPLTIEQLLGRARSTSTVPKRGARWDELERSLRALHARHRGPDGRAAMLFRTEVHTWART